MQTDNTREKMTVTKIPNRQWKNGQRPRACAYVRVSTNNPNQLDSFAVQMDYYHRTLSSSLEYEYCGIYSDKAASGMKTDRPGFLAMLELAREGGVDVIFTKSISRFARNAVYLIETIRELQALGVRVVFENDNIDTFSVQGELIISIISSIYEEERKITSENIKWRTIHNIRYGQTLPMDTTRLLGYRKNPQRDIVVDEDEAKVVRLIFDLFASGLCGEKVAEHLNHLAIPSYKGRLWSGSRIRSLIANRKYIGDVLLQQTYVNSSGKQVKNKGEKPMYLIQNNHPAIVSRELWEKANSVRKRRSRKEDN